MLSLSITFSTVLFLVLYTEDTYRGGSGLSLTLPTKPGMHVEKNKEQESGDVAQWVERLPSVHEGLGSILGTIQMVCGNAPVIPALGW